MSNTPVEALNDKYLRLYGIPVSTTALLLSMMPFSFPDRWDLFWKYMAISIVYTSLIWEVSRWFLIRVRRRFPGFEQTGKRVRGMLLAFTIVIAIGQALVTGVVVFLGLQAPNWVSPWQTWQTNFASSLFFIVLIGSAYEAIYFFDQYKNAIQKAEHLKNQQAQQQLDALKNRVNPHFLFNSLTTLSALIGEDTRLAERFVDELSKVYRYLLRSGRQPTATLAEELQCAESYSFLLKNRFEEGAFSLSIHSDSVRGLPPGLDQNVPVLTLQNALDYLVRTQNLPLKIEVKILDKDLSVSCDHQPKSILFDTPDNDWRQLESKGAKQELQSGRLAILVPLVSNPALPSAHNLQLV